jgi:hypothetical protein
VSAVCWWLRVAWLPEGFGAMARVLLGRTRLSEALRSVRASRERWRRGEGRTRWRPPCPYLWRQSIYSWGCCRASLSVRVSHRVGSGRRHGRSARWRCGPDGTTRARQRQSVARVRRRGTRAVVVGGRARPSGGASLRAGARAWVLGGMQGVLRPTLSRCGSRKNYIPSLECRIDATRCSREGGRWNRSVLNVWTI